MFTQHSLNTTILRRLESLIQRAEVRYDDMWQRSFGLAGTPLPPLSTKALNTAKSAHSANNHLLSTTDALLNALRV